MTIEVQSMKSVMEEAAALVNNRHSGHGGIPTPSEIREQWRLEKAENSAKHAGVVGTPLKTPSEIREQWMSEKTESEVQTIDEYSNAVVDEAKAATYHNGTVIPTFKPAIIRLDAEGKEISDDTQANTSAVAADPRIDNSEFIKKFPELTSIQELVYSKDMDLRFRELGANYIGVEVVENGLVNPLISFCVDFTGNYITKDKKLILNAPQIGTVAIRFEEQALLNDYLDKKFFGVNMTSMDMFTAAEKEVNKLIALSTLPAKSEDSRKTLVDLFVTAGFQNVLAEALKEDPKAQFRFTQSSYKSIKVFKLTSEVNKRIVISYDATRDKDNTRLTVEPIEKKQ